MWCCSSCLNGRNVGARATCCCCRAPCSLLPRCVYLLISSMQFCHVSSPEPSNMLRCRHQGGRTFTEGLISFLGAKYKATARQNTQYATFNTQQQYVLYRRLSYCVNFIFHASPKLTILIVRGHDSILYQV